MQRFTVEVAPSPLAANNAMHFTQCTTFGDDSLLVDPSLANNSGETLFTRSHTVGSPSYHIAHTRQLADGSPVTMDYMRHDPNGIIKGILVLIAGGGLNAAIEGAEDTSAVSHSGGDFLVRSAHRFALHGYRVLTIDRPSDFAVYGDIDQLGYLYDEYRMGPDHMVDIATVISRENSENLPVMIVGTSRGAISAVRLNELVSGIALASPVTSANLGTTAAWIGSLELPVSSIQREAHLLFHQSDLCTVTEPNGTRTTFHDLDDLGKVVNADGVAGGFQDSVHSDVCGSFDLHAYNGIENCAVEKIVTRLNSLAERLNTDSNAAPATSNGEYPEGAVIDLSQLAFDPDGDSMNYHAPSISTMGSTVEVDPQTGVVRYIPRTHIAAGVEDVFVYTVTDHKGGVSTAVIRVNYR
jgi:pimeloyl-ACP methyl ester carboxylesterase